MINFNKQFLSVSSTNSNYFLNEFATDNPLRQELISSKEFLRSFFQKEQI